MTMSSFRIAAFAIKLAVIGSLVFASAMAPVRAEAGACPATGCSSEL